MPIPFRQLVVIVALLLAGVWCAVTIRFQTELFPIFPQDLPSVRGLAVAQEAFASSREAIVVLQFPKGASSETKGRAAAELQGRLENLPGVEFVARLGAGPPAAPDKLAAWMISRLPGASQAKLRGMLAPAAVRARLAETRAMLGGAADPETFALLRYDPLRLSEFLAQESGLKLAAPGARSNARVVAICVRASKPLPTFEDCQQFIASIRSAASFANPSGGRVFITGRPAFVAETSSQMKGDMIRMIALAVLLVSLAFWAFYRSLTPLVWILLLQGLAMLAGLIGARVIFGELNVLSMGFACIILGVGMDYCILVYHHHLHSGHDGPVWRTLRRSIWLSAITTAASFGVLYFSSFPGFKQLALLIAVGLLVTACLATDLLPELLKHTKPKLPLWLDRASDAAAAAVVRSRWTIRWGFLLGVAALFALWPLWKNYPFYDSDLDRLQPAQSEAYRGQKILTDAFAGEGATLILAGQNWAEVRAQADRLAAAKSLDLSGSLLWIPVAGSGGASGTDWAALAAGLPGAFEAAGFTEKWSRFTAQVLRELAAWKLDPDRFRPVSSLAAGFTSEGSGVVRLLVQLPGTECAMRGSPQQFWDKILEVVPSALPVSWDLLKTELGETAHADFRRLSGWMLLMIFALCWLAHRSARLVAMNFFALAASLIVLFLLLRLTGASMSLLSLLAVPLLIGLVVDISLHLLIVLEHSGGELKTTFRHLAVPVCLTGLTSMIGFGTPMISRQPALQNFGFIMDLGILSAVVTGLGILPAFYLRAGDKLPYSRLLYRACFFETASRICGAIGLSASRAIGRLCGRVYSCIRPSRTAIVRRNLSLLSADPVARARARKVFVNYGTTIADYLTLGRVPKEQAMSLIHEKEGLENLALVQAEGKGCLIVTAHLGLFELGGLILAEFGFNSIALTLPEPSRELTEWRARYRKSWDLDTLEIGEEDFSFLKIVEQIHRGRFVAALVDRPYQRNRIDVDFPGGKVPFSTGPVLISLLAKCPIVPGAIVLLPSGGYRMQAYAPIRPRWGEASREETLRHYTLEIARALTPTLCKYSDQWYQFGRLA